MKLALLNPHSAGNGFSQLTLTIQSPAGTISETFTSLASALAYFDDQVISFGAAGTGFNLAITMNVITAAPGDSFRAQVLVGTGPLSCLAAASRKEHGPSGVFDVPLPLSGSPGVECRHTGGSHTLVFFFTNDVVSGTATVTNGTGFISGQPVFSRNAMFVPLATVGNAQTITVALSNVTDQFGQTLPAAASTCLTRRRRQRQPRRERDRPQSDEGGGRAGG